jgi:hypothetical protein
VPSKKVNAGAALLSELDALPVEVLMDRMTEAIEANLWERRHQMVGSTISYHAVLAAARAPEIKKLAERGTGVARTEIMDWIQNSPKFAKWVDQMNSKMEPKSYQSSITKALLKAGFIRTGLTGRYVKWYLPKDLPELSGSNSSDDGNDENQPDSESGRAKDELKNDDDENDEEDNSAVGGGSDDDGESRDDDTLKEESHGNDALGENQDDSDENVGLEDAAPAPDAFPSFF